MLFFWHFWQFHARWSPIYFPLSCFFLGKICHCATRLFFHYLGWVRTPKKKTGHNLYHRGGWEQVPSLENVLAPVIYSATISDTSSTPSSNTGPSRSQKITSFPYLGLPGVSNHLGCHSVRNRTSTPRWGAQQFRTSLPSYHRGDRCVEATHDACIYPYGAGNSFWGPKD